MRILYICNEYPPAIHGGIGIFTQTLAERLAASGHGIAVIGYASHLSAASESVENGVRVVRLPWPRDGRALRLGRLRIEPSTVAARKALSERAALLAAEIRADLVESHDWSGPLWTAPWRPFVVRLHGASSVLTALGTGKAPRLMRFLERRNARIADEIVAASRFIGGNTMSVLGLTRKPFTTLYHGIDTGLFRPDESERRRHDVLFVGTIKRRKGIHELFRAIPRILGAAPHARFTLAGRYPEDSADPCSPESLLGSLPPGLCRDPGNLRTPRVRFVGPVPQQELLQFYRRVAVAVFPSHGEAFGLACAEAMSCGAAVVVTDSGAAGELVEDGESGLVIEPRSPGALASAVIRLLDDSALRGRLGAGARLRVVSHFSLDDAAARNAAFYEQVVSRSASRGPIHV